jgi:hypothetical protein
VRRRKKQNLIKTGTITPSCAELELTHTAATLRSAERLDVTGTTPSPTDLERQSTGLTLGCDISDPYLIDWEENDPDNPQSVPFPW